MEKPLAYFITLSCYGTWLHGDERGSVDKKHNVPGKPVLPPDPERHPDEQTSLAEPPYCVMAALATYGRRMPSPRRCTCPE